MSTRRVTRHAVVQAGWELASPAVPCLSCVSLLFYLTIWLTEMWTLPSAPAGQSPAGCSALQDAWIASWGSARRWLRHAHSIAQDRGADESSLQQSLQGRRVSSSLSYAGDRALSTLWVSLTPNHWKSGAWVGNVVRAGKVLQLWLEEDLQSWQRDQSSALWNAVQLGSYKPSSIGISDQKSHQVPSL